MEEKMSDEQLKNGLMDDEERPQQISTKREEPVNNEHKSDEEPPQTNPKSNSNEEHLNNDHESNEEPLLLVTMPNNGIKKEPLNGDRGSKDSGFNNSLWNLIKSVYYNAKDRVVNHIKEHPLWSLGPVTVLLLVALIVIIILCVQLSGGNTEDANTTPIPATTPLPNETG